MRKNRHYEIVILVTPSKSAQVPALLDKYKGIITKQGGKIHRLEDWGKRNLAYPITKLTKAHYVLMNVECNEEAMETLAHDFRYNEAVLRNLVLKQKKAIAEKSEMLAMIEAQAQAASQTSTSTTEENN